jgi:sugar lactone lactonase YvrE
LQPAHILLRRFVLVIAIILFSNHFPAWSANQDFIPGESFGKRGSEPGFIKYPVGLCFDSKTNLWMADWGNQRIQIFSSRGDLIKSLDVSLDGPCGIVIDSRGYVFISEIRNNRITKLDKNGQLVERIGSHGRNPGQFREPRGIAVDSADNLYVCDYKNLRIQKLDRNGKYLTQFQYRDKRAGFERPRWVCLDSRGNLYVAYPDINKIVKFDKDGNWLLDFGAKGRESGFFDEPRCVIVDSNENILVSDHKNNRIQKFDSVGRHLETIGVSPDNPRLEKGSLSRPEGLAIDIYGNLFVSDGEHDRIQIFNLRPELLDRNKALVALRSGDRDGALEAYRNLLQVKPQDSEARKFLEGSYLARAHEQEKGSNWDAAADIYREMAAMSLITRERAEEEMKKLQFLKYRWIYYSLAISLVIFMLLALMILKFGSSGKKGKHEALNSDSSEQQE